MVATRTEGGEEEEEGRRKRKKRKKEERREREEGRGKERIREGRREEAAN